MMTTMMLFLNTLRAPEEGPQPPPLHPPPPPEEGKMVVLLAVAGEEQSRLVTQRHRLAPQAAGVELWGGGCAAAESSQ